MLELISATRRGSSKRLQQPRKAMKKAAYSTEFKRVVCRFVDDNPKLKGVLLQQAVKGSLHREVSQGTLYDIFMGRDIWFRALILNRYRHKELEWRKELLSWCIGLVGRHGMLTYALQGEHALLTAKKLGLVTMFRLTPLCERGLP